MTPRHERDHSVFQTLSSSTHTAFSRRFPDALLLEHIIKVAVQLSRKARHHHPGEAPHGRRLASSGEALDALMPSSPTKRLEQQRARRAAVAAANGLRSPKARLRSMEPRRRAKAPVVSSSGPSAPAPPRAASPSHLPTSQTEGLHRRRRAGRGIGELGVSEQGLVILGPAHGHRLPGHGRPRCVMVQSTHCITCGVADSRITYRGRVLY